jgi:16S rRNA (cytosine967-C5)-methyltransferase
MNRFIHSYLRTAELILNYYNGHEPFTDFLKRYFKQEPKFGSRDRRTITELCFCYMRIGTSLESEIISNQILVGYFLSHMEDNGVVEALMPEWIDKLILPLSKKMESVLSAFPAFNENHIFPSQIAISDGITHHEMKAACFSRSTVFLRVRPGKATLVQNAVSLAGVEYKKLTDNSYSFPNGVKIDQIVKMNKDAVVQDLSSQHTSQYFPFLKRELPVIWDACAASGGKAIMLKDHYQKLTLYISDLRDSILQQLKTRFDEAGIKADKIFKADLTQQVHHSIAKTFPNDGFDLIVADVPCTGSGTWGRNPEWLRVFKEVEICAYQDRQMKIVKNIIPFVKKGGYLLYITCSVFKQENEDVVAYILANYGLKIVRSGSIADFQHGADCLYAALFTLEAV